MQTPDESLEGLKKRWGNFDFNVLESHAVDEDPSILHFFGRIKFFASSVKKINDALIASSALMDNTGQGVSGAPLDVLKTTPMIDLALISFDFIRIPMLYIACKMMGEKVPFKMSNNAKWAFGGLLLGLGLTGLLVPVTAPVIAIALPVLLFTSAAVTFKLLCDQRKKDSIELSLLEQEIPQQEKALQNIIKQMSDDSALKALSHSAEQQEGKLKTLYHKRNKLKDSQDNLKILDGTVGMVVYSALAVGAILSVFAITAAPFVAIAGGLLSGAYFSGRFIASKLGVFTTNTSTKEGMESSSKEESTYVPRDDASDTLPYDALLPEKPSQEHAQISVGEKPRVFSVSREIHSHETHDVTQELGENNANYSSRVHM